MEGILLREAESRDLSGLLSLYSQLHGEPAAPLTAELEKLFDGIISDKNHHIVLAEAEGRIISSCVCVIIPNLTHSQRPYAVVENVVTDEGFRGRGLASACLAKAKEIAEAAGCYKIMLMTGSKKESTLRFYERAGYNRSDKTGFIMWL
ncbi:MAG: GNAT family N-acetyltransferase [Eubacteriales bacterium]|nr:GNAT family N-acetyltransferase [Eubacteriales bacterium]MDD3881156.1 GNAT family N-acetyltransferase [Eubacteriales bacterium]MDD4511538.1 GNAT family N-acetyltransferase [Eubacteriales bacterium]